MFRTVACAIVVACSLVCAAPVLAQPAVDDGEVATPSQLFVLIYRAGPSWRPGVPMQAQALGPHAAYMTQLFEQGRLFAAGPFLEADGSLSDGGVAIVRAANLEEAQRIQAEDPAVTSGLFVGEVERWSARFRTDDPLPSS